MRHSSEVGKPYRRPIIISRVHPCHGAGADVLARQCGLTIHDFIWVTNYKNWRQQIKGISRGTLVLDPCNLTHEWCEQDEMEFAIGIRSAFDQVVMAPQCEQALAAWLKDRNPDLYLRMIEAGICELENNPINAPTAENSEVRL